MLRARCYVVSAEGGAVVKAIIWQYWKDTLRNPWALIMMLGLTVLFSFVVSGGTDSGPAKVDVQVYSTNLTNEELNEKVAQLNEDPSVNFTIVTEAEALERIDSQSVEGAVNLGVSSYEFVVQREGTLLVPLVQPLLDQFYTTEQLTDRVGESARERMNQLAEAFAVDKKPMRSGSQFDQSLHSLFGFTLYFSIFTIAFSVSSILNLKEEGIWNRLILSPTTKSRIYVGNIISSFILGYAQIAIVLLIFKFVFGYSFHGGFWKLFIAVIPFLFAIMSIGVFLSGIVKNSQQLDAVIPLFATSVAMLGGAFWPLDVVGSDWILKLAYASPILYGMEMMKGVTMYNWTWQEFLLPSAVLFFIGASVIGIGINLMERKTT